MKMDRGLVRVFAALMLVSIIVLQGLPMNLQPSQEKRIRLMFQVSDPHGLGVGGARISVWHDYFGPDTRPADYQKETHVDGSVEISILAGKTEEITIEVNKDDLWSKSNFKLPKLAAWADIPIKLSKIDPKIFANNEKDIVMVKLRVESEGEDAKSEPIVGAKLIFRYSGSRMTQATGSTDQDGNATIPVLAADYDIDISKDGYSSGSARISLNVFQRGKTINLPPVKLKKTLVPTNRIEVSVHVQNSADKSLVPGARVVLAERFSKSKRVYTEYADADGNAKIQLDEPGRFDIEISQANFETMTEPVSIDAGKPQVVLPVYFLKEKEKVAPSEPVNVTVLAGDRKNAPIRGASVKVGPVAVTTNEDGKVKILTSFGLETGVVVTASAEGYKSETRTVPVRRGVDYFNAAATATFVLQPGEDPASEETPISLIIEVRDAAGKPVSGAGVEFYSVNGDYLYGALTNARGERDYNSTDGEKVPLATQRRGINVSVNKAGFIKILNRSVPSNLLSPTNTAGHYIIDLDRDWSELAAQAAALEGKVLSFNAQSTEPASSLVSGVVALADQIDKANRRISDIAREMNLLKGMSRTQSTGALGGTSSRCERAGRVKENILSYAAEAKRKERELTRLLLDANAKAAACTAPGDASIIKTNYNSVIRLVGEIGAIEQKAVTDSNELLRMSNELGIKKEAETDMENRVAEIGTIEKKIEAWLNIAVGEYNRQLALINGLPDRRAALSVELVALKKAHGIDQSMVALPDDLKKKIENISALLSVTNRDSDSGKLSQAAADLEKQKLAAADIRTAKIAAEKMLADFKSDTCAIDRMTATVEGIGAIFTNATIEMGAAADLPIKASDCAAHSACRSLTVELTAAIDSGNTTGAEPLLARMNAMGCDTAPLKRRLNAENEKAAADALGRLMANCRFEDTISFSEQFPPDVQAIPSVSRIVSAAKAGLEAEKRIVDLIDNADKTSDLSVARSNIAEARRIAAPYPCLANKLKGPGPAAAGAAVEEIPEDREADKKPTQETKPDSQKVEDLPEDRERPANETKKEPIGFWEATKKAVNGTPVVEKLPDDDRSNPKETAAKEPPVEVEDIPEEKTSQPKTPLVTDAANNDDEDQAASNAPPSANPPFSNGKAPKPKKQGPGFWEKFGKVAEAVNQGINGAGINQPQTGSSTGNSPPPPQSVPNTPPPVSGGQGCPEDFSGIWLVNMTVDLGDGQEPRTTLHKWEVSSLGACRWHVIAAPVANPSAREELNYETVFDGNGGIRINYVGAPPAIGTYTRTRFAVEQLASGYKFTYVGTKQ